MPAMTSALTALRFSGRLMVILRLDPRFSMRTLGVSVMVLVRPCDWQIIEHERRLNTPSATIPRDGANAPPRDEAVVAARDHPLMVRSRTPRAASLDDALHR